MQKDEIKKIVQSQLDFSGQTPLDPIYESHSSGYEVASKAVATTGSHHL